MDVLSVSTGRNRVRAVRRNLAPGLWVKAGPLMWRRVGSGPVPGHASSTKGVASTRDPGSPLTRLGDLRHAFVVLGRGGTADAAIAAHDGGTVLFDTSSHHVIRRYGTGPVTEDYVRMRTAFTSHVGAPAFAVGGDGEFVVEELVTGEHLLDVHPRVRIAAVQQLIGEYAHLTAEAGAGGAGLRQVLAPVAHDLAETSPFREGWDVGHVCDAGGLGDPMIWVPSAYEATTKNLMIARGGRPVPIDLGDLQLQPFFAYPIGLLISAGADVLEAYRDGEFDPALTALWAAAGQEWSGGARQRDAVLVARAAFGAARDHGAGVPGGVRALLAGRLASIEPWLTITRTGGFV
ncbi:hypothetical protein [Microbacterium oleivorans]|uniref:hypothetical protein n=1 Tax=Microbacterium oleivorans TaxID=273677 RepID=UPI00203D1F4C|nr:hypothetical protein [Microbacterium oleivorans]MCM3695177.1 hypothetical protein [Microbacterium oleivorans]